jgi:hypothetical protein
MGIISLVSEKSKLEKGIGLENYAKAYEKLNLDPAKRTATARGNK